MNDIVYLVPLFFLIALVYSSAGFGGGSSYLAILSFFSLGFVHLRMIALICNIVVVSNSVYLFSKHKFIKWPKVLPLILFSIPLAFLGGTIQLEARIFYLLLGNTLFLSSVFMLVDVSRKQKGLPRYSNGFIGGAIGFLSGLVGIGGGIFLSPFLHLSNWDKPKVIAATSAAFILANSIAGLTGQIYTNGFNLEWKIVAALLLAVFVGSQVGVRMTIFKFRPLIVKRITASVILLVAVRLLVQNL